MKKQLLLILCAVSLWQLASAQRYSTEIFSDVSVQQNIVYGDNLSVLTGTPTSVQLKMDKNYRSHKLEVIKEKVKATHPDLITTEGDTQDFSYYVRKPKKEKGTKNPPIKSLMKCG